MKSAAEVNCYASISGWFEFCLTMVSGSAEGCIALASRVCHNCSFKQRGKAAEEADNVFHHLTYEGAVDVESMTNKQHRAALESQINEFGQCPRYADAGLITRYSPPHFYWGL